MNANLNALIAKLGPTARRGAEEAARLCVARGHYEVDLEHLLLALLEQHGSDFAHLCRHYGVAASELEQALERALAEMRQGNVRTPVFAPRLLKLLQQAWLLASIEGGGGSIRTGHLLLALLTDPELAQLELVRCPPIAHIAVHDLTHRLTELCAPLSETREDGQGGGTPAEPPVAAGRSPALARYTQDLTARARAGELDPVIGRDDEIRQVIDILTRRRQNNPILTGEAGVGKTAVAEGLALRIAAGEVPPMLSAVALHALDLGLLQAGAGVRGEFESRLRGVIDEVKRSPHPIILFIDEAHTLIGAGGQAGQNDAANLLKPALARGELRTLAATTWAEYKKYFEKDAALARRFQVVKIDEPQETVACAMLRGVVGAMERHFGVRVLDDAISQAVRLSARYISGRQLPDKAVSVLDTACARVALGQRTPPAAIDEARRELQRLEAEFAQLKREAVVGPAHSQRLTALAERRQALQAQLSGDEARWAREAALVERLLALRGELETAATSEVNDFSSAAAGAAARERFAQLQHELAAEQGEWPLVPAWVDGRVVAEVIADWTGVPLGRLVGDEIAALLGLEDRLRERVIGQDHALEAVARHVRTARAGLEDPGKPQGVFLFVGPSGVGKTETALALAEVLYGGERNLITLNMSEFQEAHSVAGLKGAPPGYVGYGEGGVLTEAVRRRPYSVVLLDEVEKAHPDVLEMFYQVFDKGVLDDAEGREVDFRNTLIILTSNVGSPQIMQSCLNQPVQALPLPETLIEQLRPTLFKAFRPALLGRMRVLPYYPIADEVLADIIALKLERIARRMAQSHGARLAWDDAVIEVILARCTEVDSGARNVDHILNGTLLPELAGKLLERLAAGLPLNDVAVGVGAGGDFSLQLG